jgi:hypothetical protein
MRSALRLLGRPLAQPLVDWRATAIAGGAASAIGAVTTSGVLAQVLAGLAALSIVATIVSVRRSATLMLAWKLERLTRAVADRDALLARAGEREDTQARYQETLRDIANGLAWALSQNRPVGNIVAFVQKKCLKPMAEMFAGQLQEGGGPVPRVEIGIAESAPGGFRVTHASGPYTLELQASAPGYAGQLSFKDVLKSLAEMDFDRRGWAIVPLINERAVNVGSGGDDDVPHRWLFCVSDARLGPTETAALADLAALVQLATTILAGRAAGA